MPDLFGANGQGLPQPLSPSLLDEAIPPPLAVLAAAPRRGTLLVVDDEDGPRQSIKVIFNDAYDVLMASDGPTAVALAQKQRIDVAVLDIRMARMSGIEVLER